MRKSKDSVLYHKIIRYKIIRFCRTKRYSDKDVYTISSDLVTFYTIKIRIIKAPWFISSIVWFLWHTNFNDHNRVLNIFFMFLTQITSNQYTIYGFETLMTTRCISVKSLRIFTYWWWIILYMYRIFRNVDCINHKSVQWTHTVMSPAIALIVNLFLLLKSSATSKKFYYKTDTDRRRTKWCLYELFY